MLGNAEPKARATMRSIPIASKDASCEPNFVEWTVRTCERRRHNVLRANVTEQSRDMLPRLTTVLYSFMRACFALVTLQLQFTVINKTGMDLREERVTSTSSET